MIIIILHSLLWCVFLNKLLFYKLLDLFALLVWILKYLGIFILLYDHGNWCIIFKEEFWGNIAFPLWDTIKFEIGSSTHKYQEIGRLFSWGDLDTDCNWYYYQIKTCSSSPVASGSGFLRFCQNKHLPPRGGWNMVDSFIFMELHSWVSKDLFSLI